MMKLPIDTNVKSLFVLGAGSSVDFGLPTWNELCSMIKTEIGRNNYQYKKEIEDWLNKTGHDRKYATIDEAMAFEPDEKPYFEIGELIEDEIFQIIKKIFEESYVPNNSSWIKYLNESLLEKLVDLNKLLFINYNYDKVLDLNLLNFSFLSSKRRDYYYREQLEDIAGGSVMAIYPHGSFFKQEVSNDNLIKFVKTIKSHNNELLDAISCHDSRGITLEKTYNSSASLNILGLGGGLEVNLRKLQFSFPISSVNVTVRDKENDIKVIDFLVENYNLNNQQIEIYRSCEELIVDNFR